ncbi:hypothetical protein BDW67DRAFT_175336 [Aspergillus spinulosporus]
MLYRYLGFGLPLPARGGAEVGTYLVEEEGGHFVLEDVVLDQLEPDEVLVEMKYTGLCHTDLVVQAGILPVGSFPAVLGHEGCGVIRQVGSDVSNKALKEGDQVFLSFRTCRECAPCLAGHCGACVHSQELSFLRTRLDKSKPLAIVSEWSLVKCDVRLETEELGPLAPMGCGYLTGAGTVVNVLKPSTASTMVIMGVGAVGIAALLAAKALGLTRIVTVDVVDKKLQLALELGATHTINTLKASDSDLAATILRYLPDGADYIIDTTGVGKVLQAGLGALAVNGTFTLIGAMPPDTELKVNALDVLTGCKKIIGVILAWSDPQQIIPQLVQWYKEGKFPIHKIVQVYQATELDKALEDLNEGRVRRIIAGR